MRVCLFPETYKGHDHLEANSTLTDLSHWVDAWTEIDPNIVVYWCVPRKVDRKWSAEFLSTNKPNVFAFPERRFFDGTKYRRIDEWREEQLLPFDEEWEEHGAYFDIVLNQQCNGQSTLWRFFNELQEFEFGNVNPVQLIKHVHDYNADWKEHGRFPNGHPIMTDLATSSYADRIWTKAQWDHEESQLASARKYLDYSLVEEIDEKTKFVNSPMNFDQYQNYKQYRDQPKYVHMTGMTNARKNRDVTMEVAEFLYQRYNIETIITSQEDIEPEFREKEFTDCYPKCPYDKYLDKLAKGDLCICATGYETGGKTWFEQASSGQVFIAWRGKVDWLDEQLPDDYALLTSSKGDLKKLAAWAVQNWDEATRLSGEMIDYVRDQRNVMAVGEDTHADLTSLVQDKVNRYELRWDEPVIEQALDMLGEDGQHSLWEINDATKHFTDKGDPMMDLFTYTRTDFVQALRSMGWEDVGGRTPHFEKTGRWV